MRSARDPLHTRLCDVLGCALPVVLAGMGGVARAELVAAVSGAGGFGLLGMVREDPAFIGQQIDAVRAATDAPFGVNLIPGATDPDLLRAELEVCFARRVPAMCFFWNVVPEAVARAREAGCLVLYQVGSVEDASAAQAAGADVVIAQGIEAGGHVRGTVSTLVLVPQVAAAVTVPVVASGGFGTGAGLAAALALGADGIHCGTAFLATQESFAHRVHKERVLAASSADTVHTDAFAVNWPAGSPVRVLANSATAALGDRLFGHDPAAMPREQIGLDDGRPIWRYSTDSPLRSTTGDLEAMALFAGQVAGQIDDLPPAAERLSCIADDARTILERIGR